MDRRSFLQRFAAALAAGTVSGTPVLAAADRWKAEFAAALARNPWLLGYKTAEPGGYTRRDLQLEGKLPDDLRGTLFRNGPARHEVGDTRYRHWFDGDGMVHAFRFENGGASHMGRFVETSKFSAEAKAGRALYQGFGTSSPDMASLRNADEVNVANINVISHGGELLALWEGGSAYRLDPVTLETLGLKSWSRQTQGLPFSAHPRLDTDGTLWNFGYAPVGNALIVYRIDATGTLRDQGVYPMASVPMVHDFMITETHLIFVLPPFVFGAEDQGSFLERFDWRPEQGGRALIVDKNDLTSTREIELPPFWVFHFSNAYQSGGHIEFHAPIYENPDVMTSTFKEVMRGGEVAAAGSHLITGRIDLARGTFDYAGISEGAGAEFPRIDTRLQGQRHRFTLLMQNLTEPNRPTLDTVLRIDHHKGTHDHYTYGSGELAEEHLFVANPASADEGDGWVIGTSLDTNLGRSSVNVFDAGNVPNGPVARLHTAYPIPLGLHGNFVPA